MDREDGGGRSPCKASSWLVIRSSPDSLGREKQIFSLMAQIVFNTYQQEFLTTLFLSVLEI